MNFNDIMILFGLGFLTSLVVVAIVAISVYFYRHKIMIWFAKKQVNKALDILKTGTNDEERIINLSKAGINNNLIVQKAHEELKKQGGVLRNDDNIRKETTTTTTEPTRDGQTNNRRIERPTRQRDFQARTSTFSAKKHSGDRKTQQ